MKPWLRPADPRREAFWYRRTFRLDGPIPEVARLKVHKAMYGTKVLVNGQPAGENALNFTPGWFEVRPLLKAGENELLIRVGASLAQVPLNLTDGWDFEKSRYIPGIYDSVELFLSGTPHIVNIQTVPAIREPAVRALIEIANGGGTAVRPSLKAVVREWKSRRVVGEGGAVAESLPPGGNGTVELAIPLPGGRLWSPEDPFLYEIEVTTGADSQTARFGLREFTTDPAQGIVRLNGKPYYLRGSNVCIHRFFEDSQRGALPWDRAWVRRLHRSFKENHWNSLRYCIGFPPEFWYDIADEEGILIQDEFPVWYSQAKDGWPGWPAAITAADLAGEYTQWMRERWNHPCVVIWDAQNETSNDIVIRAAIGQVRGLDRSNRPWDNGWGTPESPEDVTEYHPYFASKWGQGREGKSFRLGDKVKLNNAGIPLNGPKNIPPKPPLIINEYAWLWLNRDGSPTTLTAAGYNQMFGPDATADERREFFTRTLAAKTEFWRMRRRCAGILHFCALGYSRADGQTSDHFLDVAGLIYEPKFLKYVRDAFAPVGVGIDFWDEQAKPGETLQVPVQLTNDLEASWSGEVTLRLTRAGRNIWQATKPGQAGPWGTATMEFAVPLPADPGRVMLVAEIAGSDGLPVRSLRDVEIASLSPPPSAK